jgi:hypothetical protein
MLAMLNTLFFKFYQFSKAIKTRESFCAQKAISILTVFGSLNIFSIIGYYRTIFLHTNQITFPLADKILIILIVDFLISYYILSGNRYLRILETIKSNQKLSGRIGTMLTIGYIFFTVIFLFGLAFLHPSSPGSA